MISKSRDEIDLVESLEDGADAWETVLEGTRLTVENHMYLLLMSLDEDLHASG